MIDLYNNIYDTKTLINNIYSLNLLDILKTQHLDIPFIVKYILNTNYQLTPEEETINLKIIMLYQPHINMHDLIVKIFNCDCEGANEIDFYSYATTK
jgi:hypothetical protein